jgi:hypothetical protein
MIRTSKLLATCQIFEASENLLNLLALIVSEYDKLVFDTSEILGDVLWGIKMILIIDRSRN